MSPRHVAFGADLLTGLMIVSVAVAAGGLTWRLLGNEAAPAASVAAQPAPARVAPDLTPILGYAPFGRASAGDAPATGLNLVLQGIMRAQPASASAAMIAVGTAPAQAFLIGQTVSGATLEAIDADRVLLRVGGRLESLAFPVLPSATPVTPTSAGAIVAAPPRDAPIFAVTPPPSLASTIGATVTEQGYRIGANPPPALAKAGLAPGDVIERINDVPVGDPEKERAMIAQASGGAVRVTLLRNGRRITLTSSLP